MGTILSLHISAQKGTEKDDRTEARLIAGHGLHNDAHAGDGDRQVSIFPVEAMSKVPPEKYDEVAHGGYTENITVSGIPLEEFAAGSVLAIGDEVQIEIRHVGKDIFKEHGRPYIVSREGRFGVVLRGGIVKAGDSARLMP